MLLRPTPAHSGSYRDHVELTRHETVKRPEGAGLVHASVGPADDLIALWRQKNDTYLITGSVELDILKLSLRHPLIQPLSDGRVLLIGARTRTRANNALTSSRLHRLPVLPRVVRRAVPLIRVQTAGPPSAVRWPTGEGAGRVALHRRVRESLHALRSLGDPIGPAQPQVLRPHCAPPGCSPPGCGDRDAIAAGHKLPRRRHIPAGRRGHAAIPCVALFRSAVIGWNRLIM